MGLIKRYYIQDKGEIVLDSKPIEFKPEETVTPAAKEEIKEDFSLQDREVSDEELLSEAQKRARSIIEEAKNSSQEIRRKAHDEGLLLGKKE